MLSIAVKNAGVVLSVNGMQVLLSTEDLAWLRAILTQKAAPQTNSTLK